MNPSEPTGQQQAEAEEHILQMAKEVVEESVAHIRGVDSIDKAFYQTFWVKGYNAGQSLSRWKEISVDGLPGGLKQYLFIKRDPSGWDSNSCRVYDFAHAIPRDAFLRSSFTHWIKLPS